MSAPTGRDRKLSETIAPEVAELAAAGTGRNEIARRLNVARATVTEAARHARVEFDAPPAEAIAGRVRQADADRIELAELAAEIADRAGRKLLDVLDGDDTQAVRAFSMAFGVSVDKVGVLARYMPEDDPLDAPRSLVREMIDAIGSQFSGGLTPADLGNTHHPDPHSPIHTTN